jgi:hypothetical protein
MREFVRAFIVDVNSAAATVVIVVNERRGVDRK